MLRRALRRVIYQVLQFLAGLEIRNALRRHFHARAGLRIASHARLALTRAKTAETPDFNLVAGTQRANNAVEDRLHNDLGILAGHFHYARDFLDQFSLRHFVSLTVARDLAALASPSRIHDFFHRQRGRGRLPLIIVQPAFFFVHTDTLQTEA